MTWSYVATASGTSSAASFSPNWPSGVQEGDVVVLCLSYSPDNSGQTATFGAANGWRSTNVPGTEAWFAWCRYSAAQPLPVIALAGASVTAGWHTVAFRSTSGAAFGASYHADGTPPATTSITTTTPNTLCVLYGMVLGDQPASWSFEPSGWSVLVNANGSGSGNPNYRNVAIACRQMDTPDTLSGIRAHLVSNRYFLLTVGEPQGSQGFFFQ